MINYWEKKQIGRIDKFGGQNVVVLWRREKRCVEQRDELSGWQMEFERSKGSFQRLHDEVGAKFYPIDHSLLKWIIMEIAIMPLWLHRYI